MSFELLPCPFCKSTAVVLRNEHDGTQSHGWTAYVECMVCKARGPAISTWATPVYRDAASQRWNDRRLTP